MHEPDSQNDISTHRKTPLPLRIIAASVPQKKSAKPNRLGGLSDGDIGSEYYLATKLDYASRASGDNLAVRRVIGIVVNWCTYARSGVGIVSILSMVKHVE